VPPSSTSNFRSTNTLKQIPSWIYILLFLIGSCELVLRIPAINSRLPSPELILWHAKDIQIKIDYLNEFELMSCGVIPKKITSGCV